MTEPPVTPVNLLAVGCAAPALRLPAAEVAAVWGGPARGSVAVCDADEDSLTLAWQAAVDALGAAGTDASAIDGLWWGTSRPPFADGPSHAFLATALGIGRESGGVLVSGSPHAGMEAVGAAWDALAAGHARVALVVVSDAQVPGVGTAGEAGTGAGAVAVVLARDELAGGPGDDLPAARLVCRATRTVPVVDRYRGDGRLATGDVYDQRLFRDEVFLPLLAEAAEAAAGAAPASGGEAASGGRAAPDGGGRPARWAVGDPDGKLAGALARRLGATSADPVRAVLGDTGAAAPWMAALPLLATPDDSPLGVVGYGGGRATAVHVVVHRPVPGATGALARLGRLGTAAGTPDGTLAPARTITYVEAVKVRGQLQPMTEPIPMGVPPGGAAFVRGNVEMLALLGAQCAACGTISTPPSVHPACTGCGGADLHTVRLARSGTVQTFVVNQTMPPPFQAPLPLVVVDLDDGARLMVQGAPVDADTLAVGDRVELLLRRYALERDVPVYGYKAFRVSVPQVGSGTPGSVPAVQEVGR